ncbi:heme-binding domain-containing protein [Chondrinema litorale]|uniref:heme-binding domain-containing protein n=1 Tax=Chondrinema litorale TaxID=2994555 RepID=UPI0025433701|nr:heme-binding domain-containing protein [Chondrinema litorale]UZR98922.1 heme-binding domain-containing protein [Chondrinema litorale]
MRKALKHLIIFFSFVFVGIQFIPTQYNEIHKVPSTDFIKDFQPPNEIRDIIRVSCYDCHSYQTNYPWYSKIQPINWLLQNHISNGISELNFSKFGSLSQRMKQMKIRSIISQIEDNKMPLPTYLIMHNNARLSKKEKNTLIEYFQKISMD